MKREEEKIMKQVASLVIVVPAKNEAEHIGKLLASLSRQICDMSNVIIVVADANSTDDTKKVVESFQDVLNVSIVPGGMPSVGRNRGADATQSRYVAFIDADMVLDDPTLLKRAMSLMEKKRLGLITTNIACRTSNWIFKFVYFLNNLSQWGSQYLAQPYATGMFMLFERKTFEELGGFDEKATYAEDFLLSRKVPRKKFAVLRGHITTDDRRFRKMGAVKVVKMFLTTAWKSARGDDRVFFETNYFDE